MPVRVFGISKQILNLFRMSLFGVVYNRGGEDKKTPPPHNLSHIIQWGTWHCYTLLEKDPKNEKLS